MTEKDNETEDEGMGAGIGRRWLLVTECHWSIASVQVGCSHCRMTSQERRCLPPRNGDGGRLPLPLLANKPGGWVVCAALFLQSH